MGIFSRKKKTTEEEAVLTATLGKTTDEDQPAVNDTRFRSLYNPLLLLTALVILIAAVVVYMQFSLLGQERRNAQTHLQTDRMADALASQWRSYAEVLAAAGRLPFLAKAIKSDDQEAINRHLEHLQTLFPGALQVRYIPRGSRLLDESADPPLGYACLELARMAEAGEEPPIEAHRFGSTVQHIDLLRPVLDPAGELVGSLLLTFDIGILDKSLQALLPPTGGYAELRQNVDSTLLQLASAGDTSLREQRTGHTGHIVGTEWSLVYRTAHDTKTLNSLEQGLLFASFAALLLVLLFGILLSRVYISRIIGNDLGFSVRHAVEIWSGQPPQELHTRLAESREILDTLAAHLTARQPAPKPAQSNEARTAAMHPKEENDMLEDSGILVEEPPEGDDMPSSLLFMNPEDSGILVEEFDEGEEQDKNPS